ncbi:MAG TPA: cell division protein FtsL [Vicinamibacteria bacterium]
MRDEALDVDLGPKAIDNSQVVREVDPRSSRDLWLLLLLAAALVSGLVLYAWPSLEIRQTTLAREQMSKERERLLEENRKLRLEKAALENLHRVETIARRDLGLVTPAPEKLVVVEKPKELPAGARLAGGPEHGVGGRN